MKPGPNDRSWIHLIHAQKKSRVWITTFKTHVEKEGELPKLASLLKKKEEKKIMLLCCGIDSPN
jgi:hypothetical protein